jgi:GMP reductase
MSKVDNRALSYGQVNLVPRYSELQSRSDADLSVEFLGRRYVTPVVPANMQSVINGNIARWLSAEGAFYIMHRFDDTRAFVEWANRENWRLISISVGVKEEDRELLRWITAQNYRVDVICIDIAHAHHVLTRDMIRFICETPFKSCLGDWTDDSPAIRDGVAAPGRGFTSIPLAYKPKIIAGNVATPEAVRDLTEWGADAVKCGLGGGTNCTTRNQTAFHIPMFTCVWNCADEIKQCSYDFQRFGACGRVPLIADGGIRQNGDIAKALVAGMHGHGQCLVMAGGLFAACTDAPGENVYGNSRVVSGATGVHECKGEITHKRHFGSASYRAKGENKHVEGVEIELPCNGLTYAEKYEEIRQSLSSAVSYAGGKDISCFRDVKWVEVAG